MKKKILPLLTLVLLLLVNSLLIISAKSSSSSEEVSTTTTTTTQNPSKPRKFDESKMMSRALGPKMKKGAVTAAFNYPWDATKNKNTRDAIFYTEFMTSFIRPDEEGFGDDYYENYDFEFPKAMLRNDVFEVKKKKDMVRRLQEGF